MTPLHKPFDRLLKTFADEAPLLFLRVFHLIADGADAAISPLRPETAPAIIMPDYVAMVEVNGGEAQILHVEFYLNWMTGIPRLMARYGGSLAWQYQRPVESVLLLLRRETVPATVPDVGEYAIGRTCTTHPYRVVRAWEADPAPILQTRDPRLLPWAILMNSTEAEVQQIAAALRNYGDEELVARFLTLGSLRYDRGVLEGMLGGPKMGFVEVFLEGSSLVREVKDKAAAEGRAEAMKAAQDNLRRLLRTCLRSTFPGLESMPEIDALSNVETVEAIMQKALTSKNRAEVEQAIVDAAR